MVEKDKKKWLYWFNVEFNGKKLEFLIKRPKRTEKEDGEQFYAKTLSDYVVKSGLLPKAVWNTILENAGGKISEKEKENYISWMTSLRDKTFEFSKLELKTELTAEETKQKNILAEEIKELRDKIQSFELDQFYIFENTADSKARNRTILWWLVKLSYEEIDSIPTEFFKGSSFDEKLDYYDELIGDDEETAFRLKIAQKFNYLITLWALNRVSSFDDFKEIDVDSNIDKVVEKSKDEPIN